MIMETKLLALLFISLAAGIFISERSITSFLGKNSCILLCSILIGSVACYLGIDFAKMQPTINSLKSLLFLLFMFASGYAGGPALFLLFRKLFSKQNNDSIKDTAKIIAIPFVVALSALGTIFVVRMFVKDDNLLGAITAGALTQTAVLGMTAKNPAGELSAGINREVVFTFTYLFCTIATTFFCSVVIPWFFYWSKRNCKTNEILEKDAENLDLADDNSGKAISFKLLPVPDRTGRAFIAKKDLEYEELRAELVKHHMVIAGIFIKEDADFVFCENCASAQIKKDDVVIILGERKNIHKALDFIGEEKFDIPREWQKNFKFSSMSIFLKTEKKLHTIRDRCNAANMCIEQIIDFDGNNIQRDNDNIELKKGTKIKLFGRRKDMDDIAKDVGNCFVVPKDKNTGIALLSICIFLAIVLAMLPVLNILGSSLLSFIFGSVIGVMREYNPCKSFGFPPQASQLFQSFGLGGYLALSGLGASDKILDISTNGLGIVTISAAAIWLVPLLSGTFLAMFLFKNAAKSAAATAGTRSSNVAYEEVIGKCGGKAQMQLMTVFSISYAIANILLTMLGAVI